MSLHAGESLLSYPPILDTPPDFPAGERRRRAFLGRLTQCASLHPGGELIQSAVSCGISIGGEICPGRIAITWSDNREAFAWRCEHCGRSGEVRDWEGTDWDLSGWANPSGRQIEVNLSDPHWRLLDRELVLLDPDVERLVAGALSRTSAIGADVILRGSVGEFRDMIDFLAHEVGFSSDGSERSRLLELSDSISESLRGASRVA